MAITTVTEATRNKASDQKRNNDAVESLARQYGGNQKTGWVSRLPKSWLPLIQLARLDPPAGLCLVYFPHLFGALHAASLQRNPPEHIVRASVVLLSGSFFFSNAAHIWNDVIDAPLDLLVKRTSKRPIPRKAISRGAATLFTITQAIGAAIVLKWLPYPEGPLYTLPSIISSTYYPWAKRHTNYPQLVLGFCLSWGIFVGSLTMDHRAFSDRNDLLLEASMLCLFLACILWTTIYDTIYAYQDVEDDIKAGIGSVAVAYHGRSHQTKRFLWLLLAIMVALLIAYGRLTARSFWFYLITVGGAFSSLGLMIACVDLKKSSSCWWWFGNGFWYAGGSIAGGLMTEYLLSAL
jgi:4-hydroxybenzoate polyprenyltransferase